MKRTPSSRPLKIGFIVVAAGLVLGLAVPGVVAAKEGRAPARADLPDTLKGEVATIAADKTSFDITLADQPPVTIKVDANTKYYKVLLLSQVKERVREQVRERLNEGKGPKASGNIQRGLGIKGGHMMRWEDENECDNCVIGADEDDNEGLASECGYGPGLSKEDLPALQKLGAKATFEDIAVGDTVVVRIMPNEKLAKQVFIMKAPKTGRVHGTITAVSEPEHTITIARSDSTTVKLGWDENTRFILKGAAAVQVNWTVTATYDADTMKVKLVIVTPPAPVPTPASGTSVIST